MNLFEKLCKYNSVILKVLSLGRNLIKSLQGIEGSCETLEQLWISYNQVGLKTFTFVIGEKDVGTSYCRFSITHNIAFLLTASHL